MDSLEWKSPSFKGEAPILNRIDSFTESISRPKEGISESKQIADRIKNLENEMQNLQSKPNLSQSKKEDFNQEEMADKMEKILTESALLKERLKKEKQRGNEANTQILQNERELAETKFELTKLKDSLCRPDMPSTDREQILRDKINSLKAQSKRLKKFSRRYHVDR
eukprot:TRINITY_DN15538_c0_g1_i3.p1 TRINITY_DN15538_c0_g1~~TRINITY_DN15538_c0_g1_i3.p1  ORF type:complete len:167 (-),score=39.30 TRINITY_DN15538_c0_g1_i3:137-637(-)